MAPKNTKNKSKSKSKNTSHIKTGRVGIDTGTILIADPSHFISEKKWPSFVKKYLSTSESLLSLKYPKGHDGMGIIISKIGGDVPCRVKTYEKDGLVKKAIIYFDN